MTIRYFADTDTALIDFTANPVVRTEEISEHVYIDIDDKGNLASMTVEHAKQSGALTELVYRDTDRDSA